MVPLLGTVVGGIVSAAVLFKVFNIVNGKNKDMESILGVYIYIVQIIWYVYAHIYIIVF